MTLESVAPLTSLIMSNGPVAAGVGKLLNTVSEQIGLFLEPHHIRRKAKAEADANIIEAKSKAEIAVVKAENKLVIKELEARAVERLRRQEERRQENMEAIVASAAKQLPEGPVSPDPVDPDWIAQFFGHCQDVSDEEMQNVWARILAGEVVKPGSFSLRALATVRVFGQRDALSFTKFCSLLWIVEGHYTPFLFDPVVGRSTDYPILDEDLLRLHALGLITIETTRGFSISQNAIQRVCRATFANCTYLLSHKSNDGIHVGQVWVTDIGQELAAVANSVAFEPHRERALAQLKKRGWDCKRQES